LRPRALYALAFLALGGAVLGGYVAKRLLVPPHAPSTPVLASAGLSPAPPAAIPARRPEFTLRDLAGRARSVHEWDGRPLLINFWASWCAPCRRETPLLMRARAAGAPRGLEVIGIAVDETAPVAAFVKEQGLAYPVLVGEQDALDLVAAFGVATPVFPFSVFVDGSGGVMSLHLGELHEPELRKTLALLGRVEAHELTLVEAQQALTRATATPAG
jgi:thiol-disulfide isomerase/thioredoxin